MRVIGWLLCVAGLVLAIVAIAQPNVDTFMWVCGGVTMACGWGIVLTAERMDLFADHPDELAQRRRRSRRPYDRERDG